MKLIFRIYGMHCASCAVIIESNLKKTLGVVSVSVNYATEKAYLDYDPAKINEGQII